MIPPIFQVAADSPQVTALLGSDPVRLYPFGRAPQRDTPFYLEPYAIWQIVSGLPENYINQVPDIDRITIQIDIYGGDVIAVAKALRDAIEPYAHIMRWGTTSTETDTGLERFGFDADWFVNR